MLAAWLALACSGLWGTADFLGGSLSRRLPVATVLLGSQAAAFAGLLVVVTGLAGFSPPGLYLGYGAAFGVIGMLALSAFYRALAVGTMGVVAPIAATGVAIPVLVGLLTGDEPAAHQYAGMGLAVVGIVLGSSAGGSPAESGENHGPRTSPESIVLALVAAVGFGTAIVLLDRGGETSIGMTLLAARSTSIVVLTAFLLLRRPVIGVWRPHLPMLIAIGAFDLAAIGALAFAQEHGDLSLTAVLGSLYPIVTVLLARRVHAERLSRGQAAGVAAALAGVVLIAVT